MFEIINFVKLLAAQFLLNCWNCLSFGEILNAHLTLFNDIIKHIYNLPIEVVEYYKHVGLI